MALEREKLLEMYTKLVKIRKFEEKVVELFGKGKIPSFLVHTYLGQEAVAVGACANLRDDDHVTSTHRGHGHLIAKGGDVKKMMAELFGKETGYCKGKGGSMHITDIDIGVLGANGIVGAGIPIAVGAGLSAKLRGTDQVTICFLGDGASNRGTFHEGINLASIWDLPVVFVVENNMYGWSMPQHSTGRKSQNIENISVRAAGYGIPGVTVDGNDVIAVYEAVREAVERARKGKGPSLVECKTYRWRGHFEADPDTYRSEEEIEEWKKKDPVERFRGGLVKKFGKEIVEKIERDVKAEIEEAVEFAENSPSPSPEDALSDVWG